MSEVNDGPRRILPSLKWDLGTEEKKKKNAAVKKTDSPVTKLPKLGPCATPMVTEGEPALKRKPVTEVFEPTKVHVRGGSPTSDFTTYRQSYVGGQGTLSTVDKFDPNKAAADDKIRVGTSYTDAFSSGNLAKGYAICPPWLNTAGELPNRLNPTMPLPPKKPVQVMGHETEEGHWQNEQRTRQLQRLDWDRYHNYYSRIFYGDMTSKEHYKKSIRETLKQQMRDSTARGDQLRGTMMARVAESDKIIAKDAEDMSQEQLKALNKRAYLSTYALANKQLSETKEELTRQVATVEKEWEGGILHYNPINWSGTLT